MLVIVFNLVTFAGIGRKTANRVLSQLGMTGIDSLSKLGVSMSGVGSISRKSELTDNYLASLTTPWLPNLGIR